MDNKDQTIKDFGDQWLKYSNNVGYYGSLELFSDIIFPFIKPEEIKDRRVAEIGSGTGRIVKMLLEAGAKHIIAVEPSDAFEVLRNNIKETEKVTFLKITGDQLPPYADLDYIFSIGVLHHIPDPVQWSKQLLKPYVQGDNFLYGYMEKRGTSFTLTSLIH